MTLDEKIVEAVATKVWAEMAPGANIREIVRTAITAYQAEAWQGAIERVKREVFRAMLDNPSDAEFKVRTAKREQIAEDYARAIVASFAPKASP